MTGHATVFQYPAEALDVIGMVSCHTGYQLIDPSPPGGRSESGTSTS